MSKYTTQLRYVCEYLAGLDESVPYSDIDDVLEDACPELFNDWWSHALGSEAKTALEYKICRHFWMEEIGTETVGEFKLVLNRTLSEIMPYYNELYKEQDRLLGEGAKIYGNTDLSVIENDIYQHSFQSDSANTADAQAQSVNSQEQVDKFNDTPQGKISNLTDGYLTSVSGTTVGGQNITAGKNKSEAEYNEGKQSLDQNTKKFSGLDKGESLIRLYKDFQDNILNIDMMIINDLKGCFMQIW